MSTEENKRLAREAIRSLSSGDLGAVDQIYAPNYVHHQHHHPNDPRDLHGVEAMKTFATELREAFPDFHDSIDIQLAEDELVQELGAGPPRRGVDADRDPFANFQERAFPDVR